MKINFQPTRKTQRLTILIVCIFVLAGILVTWTPIHAAMGITDRILMWVTYPFFMILSLLGKLLVVLINIMLAFVQFNNFVHTTAVDKGWVVVRDMCNVFLVLILLAISWGTVLRIESYHYKRTLPKFIIMAFLLNFSKTIAGFFIDLCQVIMNTFTSRFADAAAANLTTSSGLQKVLMFAQETDTGAIASVGEAFAAVALGIFLLLFMIGAVLMIIFILLGRIIVLWILVVLSPLAYLGEMISPLKKAATQWWSTFGNYVTVGPIIAFYLWLAMAVMATNPGNVGREITQGIPEGTRAFVEAGQESTGLAAGISEMSTSDNLMSYFVTIGLLYAAVMAAQQTRTIGSGLGSKVAGGMAAATGAWLARAPGTAYGWGARKIKSGALSIPGTRFQRVGKGLELNPANIYNNLKAGLQRKRAREEREGNIFADERLRQGRLWTPLTAAGAPGFAETYMQGLFYNKGIKAWVREPFQKRKEGQLSEAQDHLRGTEDDIQRRAEELRAGGMSDDEALAQAESEHPEYNAQRAAVQNLKEQVAGWEAYKPRDFMGQQMRRAADSEESKKYATTNEEELISLIQGAVARGDLSAVRAIMLQAARVGHENEAMMYAARSSDNYYEHMGGVDADGKKVHAGGFMDEKERDAYIAEHGFNPEHWEGKGAAVVKKGEYLPDSIHGAHAFFRDVLMKQLHDDKQAALALENDVSNMAESTNHWNIGQANGMRSDGTFYQRGKSEQQARVNVEMGKRDFENLIRQGNRLAFMEERHFDPNDPTKGRYARLTAYGVQQLSEKWASFIKLMANNRFNPSTAYHMVKSNSDLLEGENAIVRQNVQRTYAGHNEATRRKHWDEMDEKSQKAIGSFENYKQDDVYIKHNLDRYDLFVDALKSYVGPSGEPGGQNSQDRLEQINRELSEIDKTVTNRGPDQPAPGSEMVPL
ncbi:MAG: hypothetical protein WC497_02865 [Patescibacteria group bacterium]